MSASSGDAKVAAAPAENASKGATTASAPADPVRDCVATIPRPILAKIYRWKVARGSIMKADDMQTTSKIHTFKPPVSIPEAVRWLLSHKTIDGAIIFENQDSVVFQDGKFFQFIEL